jgi:hypothetical protein
MFFACSAGVFTSCPQAIFTRCLKIGCKGTTKKRKTDRKARKLS